jgi:hypothetical protein
MNHSAPVGRRSDWLAGLVLGFASGVCVLIGGFIGIIVLAAALLLIAWKGPRSLALTGLVSGIGLAWTVLLGRVWLTCDVLPQPPGTQCESGDTSAWAAAAVGMLVAGLIASALALGRTRRRDQSIR